MNQDIGEITAESVKWNDGLQDRFRLLVDPDGSEKLQVLRLQHGYGIVAPEPIWQDVPKVQA